MPTMVCRIQSDQAIANSVGPINVCAWQIHLQNPQIMSPALADRMISFRYQFSAAAAFEGGCLMTKSVRTTVTCQDPGDGSGDVIIDLPQDVLAAMNVGIGDLLSIESVNSAIVLKLIRHTDTKRWQPLRQAAWADWSR